MQYFCCSSRRRSAVGAHPTLNGIDFLEVSDRPSDPLDVRQRVLLVHFVKPIVMPALGPANVRIEGGDRVRHIAVVSVAYAALASPIGSPPADPRVLAVEVSARGDFSTYTLRLVKGADSDAPPDGFDPVLSAVEFSFKVNCPSDFDCQPRHVCADEAHAAPEIDYLAKDYASFRQLMLDRMTTLAPEWRERNPADAGIALVELVSYIGDALSYKQDAVGTEAYLHTARRRASVRRHVRLVDYPMHDGRNARVWVQVQVSAAGDGRTLRRRLPDGRPTRLLTRAESLPPMPVIPETQPEFAQALVDRPEVFETLHDIALRAAHNEMRFYTWGARDCCLPKGATRATLDGAFPHLAPGDVLVFIEKRGPETGVPEDANAAHRHAVRLTAAMPGSDLIGGAFATPPTAAARPVTEIEWAQDDRLPFAMCVSSDLYDDLSVALGNIVLADHGRTVQDIPEGATVRADQASSSLEPARVPKPRAALAEIGPDDEDRCTREPAEPKPPRYRPKVVAGPVTQAAPYDSASLASARAAVDLSFDDPAEFPHAAIALVEIDPSQVVAVADLPRWTARRDLLQSSATQRDFVVEVEADGTAYLRFGDGETGRPPQPGFALFASYRIGNGIVGNIGADAIAHLATADPIFATDLANPKITRVWNPIAASGGLDAESIEHARQNAPGAFRRQERAVTPSDYEEIAVRRDVRRRCGLDVQRAAATQRWTGSWYTVFLTIDRESGRDVDADFERRLRECLERYRMAGQDLEVDAPRYVPVELELKVCVSPGYFFGDVARALLDALGNRTLPDGRTGVFHPDNYTFGQPVFLSAVYAAANRVAGVNSLVVTKFQRQGIPSDAAMVSGRLDIGRLEIARLDNDPDFPERGALSVTRG